MSKIIDITDKLKFNAKPRIKVKDVEIEVNDDAMTMLELMDVFSDKPKSQAIKAAFELLFTEEDQEIIKTKLRLNLEDFETFIMAVANAVINGNEEPKGETPTPATT